MGNLTAANMRTGGANQAQITGDQKRGNSGPIQLGTIETRLLEAGVGDRTVYIYLVGTVGGNVTLYLKKAFNFDQAGGAEQVAADPLTIAKTFVVAAAACVMLGGATWVIPANYVLTGLCSASPGVNVVVSGTQDR